MIEGLLFAAIAGALIGAARQSRGVGRLPKPKRNKYAEVEFAQRFGIDFEHDQPNFVEKQKLAQMIKHFDWKPAKNANYTSLEGAYFEQLKRIYKSAVKNDQGAIDVQKSTIVSEDGREVLTVYRYDPAMDIQNALTWYDENFVSRESGRVDGYACGIYYIANGGKFIWQGEKAQDGMLLTHGLADDLISHASRADKKFYRRLIASKDKGGKSVDEVAEMYAGYNGDSLAVRDGILEAASTFLDQAAAVEYIVNMYADSQATHYEDADTSDPLPF